MKLISRYEVNILSEIDILTVKFPGPEDTSYEGGTWKIRVYLPEKYPYHAPKIGFINKVFHPNIDEASGVVCLNVIDESWSPLYDLREVFKDINNNPVQGKSGGDSHGFIWFGFDHYILF